MMDIPDKNGKIVTTCTISYFTKGSPDETLAYNGTSRKLLVESAHNSDNTIYVVHEQTDLFIHTGKENTHGTKKGFFFLTYSV